MHECVASFAFFFLLSGSLPGNVSGRCNNASNWRKSENLDGKHVLASIGSLRLSVCESDAPNHRGDVTE